MKKRITEKFINASNELTGILLHKYFKMNDVVYVFVKKIHEYDKCYSECRIPTHLECLTFYKKGDIHKNDCSPNNTIYKLEHDFFNNCEEITRDEFIKELLETLP